jgi:hypothetical protein
MEPYITFAEILLGAIPPVWGVVEVIRRGKKKYQIVWN